MDITDQNLDGFLGQLEKVSVLMDEPLTAARMMLYWEALAPTITMEEWEYACTNAMMRETFHKVPTPGAFLDYVREYRTAQREARALEQAQEQRKQIRDEALAQEQVRALIASVWPETLS